jgi:hypothetical protein
MSFSRNIMKVPKSQMLMTSVNRTNVKFILDLSPWRKTIRPSARTNRALRSGKNVLMSMAEYVS